MSKLIFAAILILSTPSFAGTLLGVGVEARVVQDEESTWKLRAPIQVFGGYNFQPWGVLLEGSYDSYSSSSSSVFGISTVQCELTAYGYRLLSYEEGRLLNPYAIAGIGALQDRVTTKFASASESDSSKFYATLKAGLGVRVQVLTQGFMMFEAKGMYSADYSPNVTFGLALRAGYEF